MNAETVVRKSLSELAARAEEAPGMAARVRAGVRLRRRRRSLAGAAGVLVLGAAGGLLASGGAPAPSPDRVVLATGATWPSADPPCPGNGFDFDDPMAYGTPLPADAVVVEAMWCKLEHRGNPAAGQAVVVEQRATTGLGPLVRELKQPDFHGQVSCTMIKYGFRWHVWVRTTGGRWLLPRWPAKPCGPRPENFTVLDTMPFRTVREQPQPSAPIPTERSDYPWQRGS